MVDSTLAPFPFLSAVAFPGLLNSLRAVALPRKRPAFARFADAVYGTLVVNLDAAFARADKLLLSRVFHCFLALCEFWRNSEKATRRQNEERT